MSRTSIKLLSMYATGMGLYGYYRGYNNLYNSNKYDKQEKLLTDKIVNGIGGMFWQLNPITQPFLLYGIIRRYEKKILNMKIDKEDYEY